MKSYRLVVRQDGRMIGHFGTNGTMALKDICVARAMFGIAGGYDCESLVAGSERRILESGPERTKILIHETCYRPVTSRIWCRVAARTFYPAYVTEFAVGRIGVAPSGRVLISIRRKK